MLEGRRKGEREKGGCEEKEKKEVYEGINDGREEEEEKR